MTSTPASAQTPDDSRLPKSLRLIGSISSGQDLRIEGIVEGDVEAQAHCVVIGPEGRVVGSIFARDLTVEGEVQGKITAVEIVDIREHARITGDVVTPGIIIAEGALVRGRIETKRSDAAVRVARYRLERRGQP